MIFTIDQLKQVSGWFAEIQAKSIGSFPSEFGVITGNDEINRVFRIEISDMMDFGIAFMRKYHTASVIPSDFDPAELPSDKWTVTDPMVDGEQHEGEYRHVGLKVYRQEQDGREYFFVLQTLAKGFEVDVTRTYEAQVSNPSSPSPDITDLKFYDSGVEYGSESVLYDENDTYAVWSHATLGSVVTELSEVGQTPDDYFLLAAGTYTGAGTWTGTFELGVISETVADLSKFRLATADHYHANHSQPVLRLENVAPSAANDICYYLNQDEFTDIEYFDDTLDGTWYRIRVRSEVQEDGSYNIFLLLADNANTDLYFRYQASPSTIRGYYYKWETTESIIDTFLSTVRFETDGTIDEDPDSGTSSTLQESVAGRAIVLRRGMRDDTDRLFDFEIEITWSSGSDIEPAGDYFVQYGEPLEKVRFIRHCAGEPLPEMRDLLGRYVEILWNTETLEWDTVADGTPGALTGRRLIRTFTKNERVIDEMIYCDLYEVEITAPMQSNDAWFYEGGSKIPERSIRTAYNGYADAFGDSLPPGDWTGGINSNYISVFFCEYRVKTTERSMKMFVRRPTSSDLSDAGDISGIVTGAAGSATTETAVEVVRRGNLYIAIKMTSSTTGWLSDAANAPSYDNTVGSTWADGFDFPVSSLPGASAIPD